MAIMMSRKALEECGLVNLGNINRNLSPAVLVEHALARKEGILAMNGAFAATTGSHTGLAERFKENFTQFALPSDEVRNAGPR